MFFLVLICTCSLCNRFDVISRRSLSTQFQTRLENIQSSCLWAILIFHILIWYFAIIWRMVNMAFCQCLKLIFHLFRNLLTIHLSTMFVCPFSSFFLKLQQRFIHFVFLFQPLAANDYLQISQYFHTVIIEDIPRLTLDSKSQARRFITLIDTLYDNRVRVRVYQIFSLASNRFYQWFLYSTRWWHHPTSH